VNQSQRNEAYWKANLGYLLNLLGVWFLVSFGGAIVFVRVLNNVNLPFTDVPFGFWLAQQGAIYVYLILIAVYVKAMNKLDRDFGVDE
jgi:putative solute:sodium symporter small subunit